jgi:hypothetical protein
MGIKGSGFDYFGHKKFLLFSTAPNRDSRECSKRPTAPFPIKAKIPANIRRGGFTDMETRRKGSAIQPTICPTEYRCYIKEDVPYATAGAVTPSWKNPSSSGQLPVPVALNARYLLCSGLLYTKKGGK